MTGEERLIALLRDALPPVSAAPSRDLWPAITAERRLRWSWVDLGIAAAVGAAFTWEPAWLLWLSYHL